MATYSTTPVTVQAVQFDGTLATAATFLVGQTFSVDGSGNLMLESARGRVRGAANDWMVKMPTTLSDLTDDSVDFIYTIVPASSFAGQYTFVSNP